MMHFEQIGTEVGALVARKNAAYGSSFETAGAALQLLFPQGIPPERMQDALLLARIWDKLSRIAHAPEALSEDPYEDIAGYGILGSAITKSRKAGHATPCASVSAAEPPSPVPNASAARPAPTPTSAIASAPNVLPSPLPSTLPSSDASPSAGAFARAATVGAGELQALLARAKKRNEQQLCGGCNRDLVEVPDSRLVAQIHRLSIGFCCAACFYDLRELCR